MSSLLDSGSGKPIIIVQSSPIFVSVDLYWRSTPLDIDPTKVVVNKNKSSELLQGLGVVFI